MSSLRELGGIVGDVHFAAQQAGGAELIDDAGAGELHRLAVEPQVGELQPVVGVRVGDFGGELELGVVPGDGGRLET